MIQLGFGWGVQGEGVGEPGMDSCRASGERELRAKEDRRRAKGRWRGGLEEPRPTIAGDDSVWELF